MALKPASLFLCQHVEQELAALKARVTELQITYKVVREFAAEDVEDVKPHRYRYRSSECTSHATNARCMNSATAKTTGAPMVAPRRTSARQTSQNTPPKRSGNATARPVGSVRRLHAPHAAHAMISAPPRSARRSFRRKWIRLRRCSRSSGAPSRSLRPRVLRVSRPKDTGAPTPAAGRASG